MAEGHDVTIGGERLGTGKKMKAYLRNYDRSTHQLDYIWRSTMSAGTLVPFMKEVALPGDTFDIELDVDVLTHPTIGPLFGTYKIQLDVFLCPIRLYQGQLHMNQLGIGMDMSKVKLPTVVIPGAPINKSKPIDNQQVHPSCIFSYLGIRGTGYHPTAPGVIGIRGFNAVPYLAYWDIYKNYYANKQEEKGAVIHRPVELGAIGIADCDIVNSFPPILDIPSPPTDPIVYKKGNCTPNSRMELTLNSVFGVSASNLLVYIQYPNGEEVVVRATTLFKDWESYPETNIMIGSNPTPQTLTELGYGGIIYDTTNSTENEDQEPLVLMFDLKNIDDMKKAILQHPDDGVAFGVSKDSPIPYSLPLNESVDFKRTGLQHNQEGLALKTYQSDLFNNWISTEWIDGVDGISAVTAIDTSDGSFTIDELNLSKKIYDMLNRIAISGGSYDDWLDAVYTHDRQRSQENPSYIGGLISNLVFQEVISNAEASGQPLGTLAGRGKIGNKRKGGEITVKVDEPAYIIGIVSLTPNIDYSQGNAWDTNLESLNDFHKPALDEIGFQDLITDQMAWYDTYNDATGVHFSSAGKQPAWVNYMTNVNKVYGNFADQNQQMFMVLNRRYSTRYDKVIGADNAAPRIGDLTTYIDPSKFNHIFADTRRDAQNFWTQIGVQMTARRKMSAKIIPNL